MTPDPLRPFLPLFLLLLFCGTPLVTPTATAGEPGPPATHNRPPPRPTPAAPVAAATPQTEVLSPTILTGPPVHHGAHRSEAQRARLQRLLEESDRILSPHWPDQGRLHGTWSGRMLIGPGEEVLLDLTQPAPPDTVFMVYRPVIDLTDPHNDEAMGTLAHHVGRARMTGERTGSLWHARIIKARRELETGDRLLHDYPMTSDFNGPTTSPTPLQGRILHLLDDVEMAGAHQIVVVGMGRREKATLGLILTIRQHRNPIPPPDPEEKTRPAPSASHHTIGTATLFHIGEKASFAVLEHTLQPVRRGDELSSR